MPKLNKIDSLYKKSLRIIERDINHLSALVIGGKLDADASMDLNRYVKLLADMKKAQERQKAEAAEAARAAKSVVTDEELLEAATKEDK
jgi:hypothetical protein